MGNQQIILLVLGTIVVAIAVTIGIMQFREYYTDSVADEIATVLLEQAQEAKIYFLKPRTLGGGNKSFVGFTLPRGIGKNTGVQYTSGGWRSYSIMLTATAREGECTAMLQTRDSTNFTIAWQWSGEFNGRNMTTVSTPF